MCVSHSVDGGGVCLPIMSWGKQTHPKSAPPPPPQKTDPLSEGKPPAGGRSPSEADPPTPTKADPLPDTVNAVNRRAVHILLECILVTKLKPGIAQDRFSNRTCHLISIHFFVATRKSVIFI